MHRNNTHIVYKHLSTLLFYMFDGPKVGNVPISAYIKGKTRTPNALNNLSKGIVLKTGLSFVEDQLVYEL